MIVKPLRLFMKINKAHLLIFFLLSKACLGQIDRVLIFDYSSEKATRSANVWVDYSKDLMADSYGKHFIHYVHNGSTPLVSKFDSEKDLLDQIKLVKKTRPVAQDELMNLLYELDAYEISNNLIIEVVCSSDVFYSNDQLLYGRLKWILGQLNSEVKLIYHIPESEKANVEDLIKGKDKSIFQIKYF